MYGYETTHGIRYETSDLTEYETPRYESSVIHFIFWSVNVPNTEKKSQRF